MLNLKIRVLLPLFLVGTFAEISATVGHRPVLVYKSLRHGLINYKETKTKCRHLK
jgi:hypothetical protein